MCKKRKPMKNALMCSVCFGETTGLLTAREAREEK